MGLNFQDLTARTRELMLEEIGMDTGNCSIYLSNYLNGSGQAGWPSHLRDAATNGSDDSLAATLREHGAFKDQVERRKPKGGYTMAAVPHTAAQTLAESQFNMYYMRALARRAIEEGQDLAVYRAKEVENPRSESQRMIGTNLDPEEVLRVLRQTHGVEPDISIPMPNTGITIRLTVKVTLKQ